MKTTKMKKMMRFKFIVGSLIFLTISSLSAQTDQKAKLLLDKLSAKTKAYTSIKANFNYILENKAEGLNEVQSGWIVLKGDKFILEIAGQEILSDGATIWTYLKDAEEVQITDVEEDNEDQISPGSIFTLYESGYRHEYKKDETSGGINYAIIYIYPLDLDEKSFHTIQLYIDKDKIELKKIIILSKEGDNYTYKIKSFQTNIPINDSDFVFQKSKYPDVEIVDLR